MAPQYPSQPGSVPGGSGPYPQAPANGMGTAALVMGILQFICLGLIGSILAIVFGKIGMDRADQGLANNRSTAKAGFVLGIIGVVLSVVGAIITAILIASGTITYTRY